MTITRANPGGWAQNDLLTPVQANTIDINTTLAPDFVNGGAYTPAAPVEIDGAGLKLAAGGSAGQLQYGTRTIRRHLHLQGWVSSDCTNYRMPVNAELGTVPPWQITNLLSAVNPKPYWQIMNFPNGATLDRVWVLLLPSSGHGALPATMPAATIGYFDVTTGSTMTTVATATDSSATVGAYEAYHPLIAGPGLAHVIDTTKNAYVIQIAAESSTNYIAGTQFKNAYADFIVTSQSEIF